MDGLCAWLVLTAEYCDHIAKSSTKIFNYFSDSLPASDIGVRIRDILPPPKVA
jgi:hypothetical protein